MFGRVKRDWENWWVQWPMLYNFNDVDDRSFPWWFRIWPLLLQGGGFKHCFDNVNFTHTLRKGFNLAQGKFTDSEQRTFHRDCRLRFTLPYLCHTMPTIAGGGCSQLVPRSRCSSGFAKADSVGPSLLPPRSRKRSPWCSPIWTRWWNGTTRLRVFPSRCK